MTSLAAKTADSGYREAHGQATPALGLSHLRGHCLEGSRLDTARVSTLTDFRVFGQGKPDGGEADPDHS